VCIWLNSLFKISEFQNACLQLINALVTQPDELDFRMHLRNEIVRTGLTSLLIDVSFIPLFLFINPLVINGWYLKEIRRTEFEDLKRQVEIFIEHRDSDADEFYQRFENIKSEFDTVSGCSELLLHKVKDTACEPYFLSILQHFLLIRDTASLRWDGFFENVVDSNCTYTTLDSLTISY